jgi:hypothetical protein
MPSNERRVNGEPVNAIAPSAPTIANGKDISTARGTPMDAYAYSPRNASAAVTAARKAWQRNLLMIER